MPVFSLRRPPDVELRALLARQKSLPFAYPEVGASREGAHPPGYGINWNRGTLGRGAECYARAAAALRTWQMYHTGWTEIFPADAPAVPGTTLLTLARHFGLWSVNAVRVVYTDEEETAAGRRFRLAIGTLPAHAERGEERFTVEWDRNSDIVTFEVRAFTRIHAPLAKLGYPLARLTLRRFARTSLSAMRRAVDAGAGG